VDVSECLIKIKASWKKDGCTLKYTNKFIVFVAEALSKILALGIRRYLSSGWNLFDLGTSIMTLVAACALILFPSAMFFVLFRPLRTLRLFKIKKRYRDVFGTLVILLPQMCSTAIVMLVLYYFFAIIGMELFAGYDMRNCCKLVLVLIRINQF
jgi:two pore calcium channel protein 1